MDSAGELTAVPGLAHPVPITVVSLPAGVRGLLTKLWSLAQLSGKVWEEIRINEN